jgi:hypothetical protein
LKIKIQGDWYNAVEQSRVEKLKWNFVVELFHWIIRPILLDAIRIQIMSK